MKKLIGLSLLVLSSQILASDCMFKELPGNKVYALPMYEAKTDYMFSKSDRTGMARVHWSLNEEVTKQCFQIAKQKYPNKEIFIPTVRLDWLKFKVLGSSEEVEVQAHQQSNNHWFGSTGFMEIPYYKRSEIEVAIKNKEDLVTIIGDFRYRQETLERKPVAQIECMEKQEEPSVMNLMRRMNEIRTIVQKRNAREEANVEDVLQQFLGTCVDFEDVEAESLTEFDSKVRRTSRMKKGSVDILGNVRTETSHPLAPAALQSGSILDI